MLSFKTSLVFLLTLASTASTKSLSKRDLSSTLAAALEINQAVAFIVCLIGVETITASNLLGDSQTVPSCLAFTNHNSANATGSTVSQSSAITVPTVLPQAQNSTSISNFTIVQLVPGTRNQNNTSAFHATNIAPVNITTIPTVANSTFIVNNTHTTVTSIKNSTLPNTVFPFTTTSSISNTTPITQTTSTPVAKVNVTSVLNSTTTATFVAPITLVKNSTTATIIPDVVNSTFISNNTHVAILNGTVGNLAQIANNTILTNSNIIADSILQNQNQNVAKKVKKIVKKTTGLKNSTTDVSSGNPTSAVIIPA